MAAALLVGGAALVYVGVRSHDPSRSRATGSSSVPVAESAEAIEPADPVPSSAVEDPTAMTDADVLVHFHEALRDLVAHARADHVRVLFFGDSHAASGLLTGPLRRAMAAKFGDGGPGFVYAGLRDHPNDGIASTMDGVFVERPKAPSSSLRTGDGEYGLGGVLAAADHDTASVTLIPRHVGRTVWDICYRSPPHASVSVSVSGATPIALSGAPDAIEHRAFVSGAPGAITLDVSGDGALCGAIAERDPKEAPGIVLDTLGISGARYSTALSWDASTFEKEVARRHADLVVFEYGTNESAEKELRPDVYAKDARDLIARVRSASPDASCVVIGPTEIEAHPEAVRVVSPAIKAAASQMHCAFWSPFEVMGGPGAMKAWRESDPPLAQSDGIHLTAPGYGKLADALFHDLVVGVTGP